VEPEELRKRMKTGAIVAAFFALALLFYALGWRGALVAYVVLVGVLAVLAILLQSGRGGGLVSSLGGLGGDSLLGTHSATPIAKATYVMLALFIFICMLTAHLGAGEEGDVSLLPREEPPLQLPLSGMGGGAETATPAEEAEPPASSAVPAPQGPEQPEEAPAE
jgi:protein translocase SecG subunit